MVRSDLGYVELTGPEFLGMLGAERPALYETFPEACRASGLRAVRCGLLPWETTHGQTVALAWPGGECAGLIYVAPKVFYWLVSRA